MSFTSQGTYMVYKAGSQIYIEDAAAMRDAFKEALEKGHKHFAVDFSDTSYIDSAGLGVLVSIHKKALVVGGGVKLIDLKGNVKDIFELTRLNKVFDIVDKL